MEPHAPYIPPTPYDTYYISNKKKAIARKLDRYGMRYLARKVDLNDEEFEIIKALYDGEIAYLDSKLKDIFDTLRELDLLDNTVLIITSDHGENFGEHHLMNHLFCL